MLPTTFMKLANFQVLNVRSTGEATRRMVDLSLVLDVSSSIGGKWGAVRDATRAFINSFDANGDRMSLTLFGNGAEVSGCDAVQPRVQQGRHARRRAERLCPVAAPTWSKGLYRGWDEIRSVANGQQSGLRVIVLFTDGASNSVPGIYPGFATPRSLRTYDFPDNGADPDSQTHPRPHIAGLFDPAVVAGGSSQSDVIPVNWDTPCVPVTVPPSCFSPQCRNSLSGAQSRHNTHRSSGIPTTVRPPDRDVEGERGCAEQHEPTWVEEPRRLDATRPTSGTSTTRRGTSSRSSPTRRGAMPPATTRSGSTRSAWAIWCDTTSGRCPRRPRAS